MELPISEDSEFVFNSFKNILEVNSSSIYFRQTQEVWIQIESKFNVSLPGDSGRDAVCLKTKYENIKKNMTTE